MGALRQLGASQQVGLLFVLLFGALARATAVAGAAFAARAPPADAAPQARTDRELRALWIGAAPFWLAGVAGPLGATLLFGATPACVPGTTGAR